MPYAVINLVSCRKDREPSRCSCKSRNESAAGRCPGVNAATERCRSPGWSPSPPRKFPRLALALALAATFAFSWTVSAGRFRLNCAGPSLPDIGWIVDTGEFRKWDHSYSCKSVRKVSAPDTWREVYNTFAWAPKTLLYRFRIPPGPVSVRLLFAETVESAATKRLLSVAVYGRDLGYKSPVPNYTGIDVFAAAGGSHKGYLFNAGNTTVDDSRVLNIQISTSVENPILPGIVLDGTGPVSPVPTERGFHSSFCEVGKQRNNFEMNIGGDATDKVAAENEAYILDPKGRIAFTNANLFLSVYQSLRYTLGKTLSIRIPVPNGVYTGSMWHAETSFKAPGKSAHSTFSSTMRCARLHSTSLLKEAAPSSPSSPTSLMYRLSMTPSPSRCVSASRTPSSTVYASLERVQTVSPSAVIVGAVETLVTHLLPVTLAVPVPPRCRLQRLPSQAILVASRRWSPVQ